MSLRSAVSGEDSLVAWRGSGTDTEVFSFLSVPEISIKA